MQITFNSSNRDMVLRVFGLNSDGLMRIFFRNVTTRSSFKLYHYSHRQRLHNYNFSHDSNFWGLSGSMISEADEFFFYDLL